MAEVFRPVPRFEGILAALYREHGNNILSILTIQLRRPSGPPKTIFPLVTGCPEGWAYATEDNSDAAYIFDFTNQKIVLTGYLLKSHTLGTWGGHWASDWIVEGSNDYANYQQIHAVQGCKDLVGLNLYSFQTCDESPPFQFIRIRLTAPTESGKWHFLIGRIEFFGRLVRQDERG
jgi:hypothetical protein